MENKISGFRPAPEFGGVSAGVICSGVGVTVGVMSVIWSLLCSIGSLGSTTPIPIVALSEPFGSFAELKIVGTKRLSLVVFVVTCAFLRIDAIMKGDRWQEVLTDSVVIEGLYAFASPVTPGRKE